MGKSRHIKSAYRTPVYKDSAGNVLCRYCMNPVGGRRRTFCSDHCVYEWKVRSNPGFAREQVYRRDRGRCCLCGTDTTALATLVSRMSPAQRAAHLTQLGIPTHRESFWDMDHIHAVESGGGSCGLDNLRTLCIPCHAIRTAEQTRTRHERPS